MSLEAEGMQPRLASMEPMWKQQWARDRLGGGVTGSDDIFVGINPTPGLVQSPRKVRVTATILC
jgi:hypothetical protein